MMTEHRFGEAATDQSCAACHGELVPDCGEGTADVGMVPWWEQPRTLIALILASVIPLLWPDIPPLTDLPGHMARYKVALDLADSSALQQYYGFRWALFGNLGVDLLVIPLSNVFGLELSVKLIVIIIPPLTVAGFLLVAREVHGRVPPMALFAVPLAYNFPFIFGFVNFSLSMALAFLAFALWLRLARRGRLTLRAVVFVPISCVVWLTHMSGWGALGVLAFSADCVRQIDRGKTFVEAAVRASGQCIALALPLVPMLLWRAESGGGETGDWFNLVSKVAWLTMALRDRWMVVDLIAISVIAAVLYDGLRNPRFEFSRNLSASALTLLLSFLLLPRILFGSAYADMRLVPYMLATAVLAVRFRGKNSNYLARNLAIGAVVFFMLRTAALTTSFYLYDQEYDRHLPALDNVPKGGRLLTFVGSHCEHYWYSPRLEHISGIAVVRREAFSNDQWEMPGAQLLSVHYAAAGGFAIDPSQTVTREACRTELTRTLDQSLAKFPRAAFDYIWLIDPPVYDASMLKGMRPVWRSGTSVLYRVVAAPTLVPDQNPD